MKWSTALILASALGACDASLGPPEGYLIEYSHNRQSSPVQESVVADAGINTVIVNGALVTPSPCVDLDPDVRASGRDITLTVTAETQSGPCVTSLGYFTYLATLGQFNPGSYRLKVQHKINNTTRVVYDREVTFR